MSWTPSSGSGTYLIGGRDSKRTTTLIKPDGTQEPGFPLKYDTKQVLNGVDIKFETLFITAKPAPSLTRTLTQWWSRVSAVVGTAT